MTFRETLCGLPGAGTVNLHSPEPLAGFDYAAELELKQCAFRRYLANHRIPGAEKVQVTPSPLPRHYRTTGKRRASVVDGRLHLHYGRVPGDEEAAVSPLEPATHGAFYAWLARTASQPRNMIVARELNYAIVRGNPEHPAVIFNMRRLDGAVVRALKGMTRQLNQDLPAVRSAFIYLDETDSDYYLEAERPAGSKVAFKKLFGPELLDAHAGERKFLYPPTVFSQVNESILPAVETALEHAFAPGTDDTLIDLYCGYGLWSLLFAGRVGKVCGVELAREAVIAARANAAYHAPGKCRYTACGIEAEHLMEYLPEPSGGHELVLLDPPRNGCAPGVIEKMISRAPRRIGHLFCGTDALVRETGLYLANGCRLVSLTGFDFFPGTANIETFAVFEPHSRA